MTSPESRAQEGTTHVHEVCYACAGTDGYYPTVPQHDDCVGRCEGGPEWLVPEPDSCTEPCPCECNVPLSRSEIMRFRYPEEPR